MLNVSDLKFIRIDSRGVLIPCCLNTLNLLVLGSNPSRGTFKISELRMI